MNIKFIFRALRLAANYIFGSHVKYRVAIEQYPDTVSGKTTLDLFPKTKGFLTNDLQKCTGCGDCIAICPVGALDLTADQLQDGSKRVKKFTIDLGRCYSCSACLDSCPVNSLSYTKSFEMAVSTNTDLIKVIDLEKNNPNRGKHLNNDSIKIRTYEVRR